MGRGIFGLVGLAVTLAFAVPIGLLGLEKLLAGEQVVGAGFLAVAVGLVLVEEYLTTPLDLPGKAAETVTGAIVKEPDDEE